MIHSSIDNFKPGLQHNSEQNADEMHVSPDFAKSNVCAGIVTTSIFKEVNRNLTDKGCSFIKDTVRGIRQNTKLTSFN